MAAGGPFVFNPGGPGGSVEPAAPARRIGPREQCTKVFADALAEGANGADVAPKAEALEAAVFDRFPDEKSKDYRAKVKTASQGLKGSRNAQLRQALLAGAITAEDILSLDPKTLEQKAKDAAKSLPPPPAPAPRPMLVVPAAVTQAEEQETKGTPQEESLSPAPPEKSVRPAGVSVVSAPGGALPPLPEPQPIDEPQPHLPPNPRLEPAVDVSPNLVQPSSVKQNELHPHPTAAMPLFPIVNQNVEHVEGAVPPAPAFVTTPPNPEPSTSQPAKIASGVQAPVGQSACDNRRLSGGAAPAVAFVAATACANKVESNQPRSAALEMVKAAREAVRVRRQSAGPSMRNKPMSVHGGSVSAAATPDHEINSLRQQLEAATTRGQRLEAQLAEQMQDSKMTGSRSSTPKGETAANQAVARLTMEVQMLQRQLEDDKQAARRREQALEEHAKDLSAKLLDKASSAGGDLQVRLVKAEAQATASQSEARDLKAQLEGMTTEMEKLKQHLTDFRRQSDELSARHDALVEKHEDAESELQDLHAQLKRATDTCHRTEKDRDCIRHVCRELESQIQVHKQRAEEYQRERDNLVLRAAEAAAAPTMVPSRGPSEEELQALRTQLASTREELDLAHKRLAADSTSTKQREQRELELTAIAERCEQEKAIALRREQEAVSALSTLRNDLAKVQSQNQTLEVQVSSLHQELEMTRRDRRSKVMGILERTKQTMASNALAMSDGPVPCSFSTEVPSPAVAVHGLNAVAPPVQLPLSSITNGFQENNSHPLGRQPHQAQDASSLFGGPSDISPATAVSGPAVSVPSVPPVAQVSAPTLVGVPPPSADVLRPAANEPNAFRHDPFGAPSAESMAGASQRTDASGLFGDASASQPGDASDLIGTGPAKSPKDNGDPFACAASAPERGPISELFGGGPPECQQRDASSLFGDGAPTSNSNDAPGLFGDETAKQPSTASGHFSSDVSAVQPHDTSRLFGGDAPMSQAQPTDASGLFSGTLASDFGADAGTSNDSSTAAQSVDASKPFSNATPTLQPDNDVGLDGTTTLQLPDASWQVSGSTVASQPRQTAGLLGADAANLQPSDASGLFGHDPETSQRSDATAFFGGDAPAMQPSDTSMPFGNSSWVEQPSDASGLFGEGAQAAQPSDTSGLFGDAAPISQPSNASNLFGDDGPASQPPDASALFADNAQASQLFGASDVVGLSTLAPQPSDASGLFSDASPSQPADASGLFESGQQPSNASGLFGDEPASKPSDASGLFDGRGAVCAGFASPAAPAVADTSGLFGSSEATKDTVIGAANPFFDTASSASAWLPPGGGSNTTAVTSPAADALRPFSGSCTVGTASDLFSGVPATDASHLFGGSDAPAGTVAGSASDLFSGGTATVASDLFGGSDVPAGSASGSGMSGLFAEGPPKVVAPTAATAPVVFAQPMQSMPPMQVTQPHQHMATVGLSDSGHAPSLFGENAAPQAACGFLDGTAAVDTAFGGPVAMPAASTGVASKNDVSSLF